MIRTPLPEILPEQVTHVECESMITFNSDMSEDDVNHIFEVRYKYRELEKKDGSYVITVYGDAPFPDNIEGH